jgi:hypothetical protein
MPRLFCRLNQWASEDGATAVLLSHPQSRLDGDPGANTESRESTRVENEDACHPHLRINRDHSRPQRFLERGKPRGVVFTGLIDRRHSGSKSV